MDALRQHLQALEDSSRYRVDAVLKHGETEITERVFLRRPTATGEIEETGPFIRKTISRGVGLGTSYQRIWDAQCAGRRFAHLPQLTSICQDAEHLFVVMEWIPGITLGEWVKGVGPGINAARQLFPTICEGVRELHEEFDPPIIHRDIKPDNIMVSAGHVTIIDLGIARTFDPNAEQDTRHFGTRAYAPPEQYGFGQTDQRSDVYALGMLLYFLLTGESAYETKAREQGFAHPAVPKALRDVLMTATAFDPSQRYESVEGLLEAFLDADEHREGAAAVPPAAKTTTRTKTAHPTANRQGFVRLGKVWNGVLLADLAFWALSCIVLTFSPGGNFVRYTFGERIVIDGSLFLLFFTPLTFVLMDKRRLRERFAWADRLRSWKLATVTAACIIVLGLILSVAVPDI